MLSATPLCIDLLCHITLHNRNCQERPRVKKYVHFKIPKGVHTVKHGLSQQGVWVPFWTPKPLKRTPQDTQIFLCGISKNLNLKLLIEFFHLLIIPMALFNDIMHYFDEFIHVKG